MYFALTVAVSFLFGHLKLSLHFVKKFIVILLTVSIIATSLQKTLCHMSLPSIWPSLNLNSMVPFLLFSLFLLISLHVKPPLIDYLPLLSNTVSFPLNSIVHSLTLFGSSPCSIFNACIWTFYSWTSSSCFSKYFCNHSNTFSSFFSRILGTSSVVNFNIWILCIDLLHRLLE